MDPDQPPPLPPEISPGAIARDVLIIWGLTLLGGMMVWFAVQLGTISLGGGLAVSNFTFATLGFMISGCLARGNRWKHLAIVAVIIWLTNAANVMFGATIAQWLISSVFVGMVMALGGALSFLFRK